MSRQVPFSALGGRGVYLVDVTHSTTLVLHMEGGLAFAIQPVGQAKDLRRVVHGMPLILLNGRLLRVAQDATLFKPTEYDVSAGVCYVLATTMGFTMLTWERKANGYSVPITVTEYNKGEFDGLR